MTALPANFGSQLVCRLIEVYQVRISPHKGFCCARRVLKGGASCSAFAKRAISRGGLIIGGLLLRRRFASCHNAKRALDYQSPSRERDGHRYPYSSGCDMTPTPLDAADCLDPCLGECAAEACCAAANAW
jgi:putative component of membrane protein insertase Oxa1/YidC/SpoIIIJ protein YidD